MLHCHFSRISNRGGGYDGGAAAGPCASLGKAVKSGKMAQKTGDEVSTNHPNP